jgi:hypothetical protein
MPHVVRRALTLDRQPVHDTGDSALAMSRTMSSLVTTRSSAHRCEPRLSSARARADSLSPSPLLGPVRDGPRAVSPCWARRTPAMAAAKKDELGRVNFEAIRRVPRSRKLVSATMMTLPTTIPLPPTNQ